MQLAQARGLVLPTIIALAVLSGSCAGGSAKLARQVIGFGLIGVGGSTAAIGAGGLVDYCSVDDHDVPCADCHSCSAAAPEIAWSLIGAGFISVIAGVIVLAAEPSADEDQVRDAAFRRSRDLSRGSCTGTARGARGVRP